MMLWNIISQIVKSELRTSAKLIAPQQTQAEKGNGTTIEQQIKAVEGEVKMYASSMTWHEHQKALDDAVRSLKELKQLKQL